MLPSIIRSHHDTHCPACTLEKRWWHGSIPTPSSMHVCHTQHLDDFDENGKDRNNNLNPIQPVGEESVGSHSSARTWHR